MARKRMIDPEFWSDEEVCGWSFCARLFYIALWNFADDEGRLKAHPKLLSAQVFPYDCDKIDIEKLKSEVAKKVKWYKVDGQQYGFVVNFKKHQHIDRPRPSVIPKFDDASPNPRRKCPPKRREVKLREVKLREGNGKGNESPAAPTSLEKEEQDKATTKPVFNQNEKADEWLAIYPKRKGRVVGKQKAKEDFCKLIKTETDFNNLMAATRAYAGSRQLQELDCAKDPERFLKKKYWQDWIPTPVVPPNNQKPFDITEKWKKEEAEFQLKIAEFKKEPEDVQNEFIKKSKLRFSKLPIKVTEEMVLNSAVSEWSEHK